MYESLLKFPNLNQRKYVHGTSIVRGVIEELISKFDFVQNFKIRLLKPLYHLPIIHVGQKSEDKPAVAGSFEANGLTIPYYLTESDQPCTGANVIDERELERRVLEWPDRFIVNLNRDEDIMVAWSAIERPCNFALFDRLGMLTPGKQMWFTGMELDNLSFFEELPMSVGSSTAYERPSEFCIRREIYFNQRLVGIRTAVYA